MAAHTRPTREEILAAWGSTLEDLIAPGLRVLFCGINPGLYSGAAGHHFARPGNRFWSVLHAAGFTGRLLAPHEERELLKSGCGITNLVQRATAGADDLSRTELAEGGRALAVKAVRYRPGFVAFIGVGAYRAAFSRPGAAIGLQAETIGPTRLWVLPSTSGLNAHYRFGKLVSLFGELRRAAGCG